MYLALYGRRVVIWSSITRITVSSERLSRPATGCPAMPRCRGRLAVGSSAAASGGCSACSQADFQLLPQAVAARSGGGFVVLHERGGDRLDGGFWPLPQRPEGGIMPATLGGAWHLVMTEPI